MQIESFGFNLFSMRKSDHHVIDDIVMFGQSGRISAHQWKRYRLLSADYWIVGHVINLCINVLLFITTPEKEQPLTTTTYK